MDRGPIVRTGVACAAWVLVTWAHAAPLEPAGFALFAGCAIAALAIASLPRGACPCPEGACPRAPDTVVRDVGLDAERDALRRLEAELHALSDQVASAPDPARRPAASVWSWAHPPEDRPRG